jgi:peroxiredoxin Q/BCP
MNSVKRLQLALFTLALLTPSALAKVENIVALKVGDQAPHFVGVDDQNKEWGSKDKAGKKIYVVYFYPADMTGGCTKQACAYRDAVKAMKRKDVEIIGVSGDSAENHQHFKNEYQLNFTLLADTDGKIADAFGVKHGQGGSIVRKLAGKDVTLERGVTTNRWTFVIDKDWRIAHKDTKVKATQDSANVLKVIEKLK